MVRHRGDELRCEIFIVMGKTDPDVPRRRQQSQILVPRNTPGLTVRRGMAPGAGPGGVRPAHRRTRDGPGPIAESRVRLEQCRLLLLKTAWLMDTVGSQGAHTEIQAIKIAVPGTIEWIIGKAIRPMARPA
jgi:acyl-CoA dehydrogenase